MYEVDLPPLSRRKAAIIAEHGDRFGAGSYVRVEIDFRRQALADVLAAAGFARGARTFVVWEGVAPYLDSAAVDATLTALRTICGTGSVLAMDMWDGTGGPGPLAPLRRLGARAIALIGEPVTFGAPPEGMHRVLARHGFAMSDLADAAKLAHRYATGGRHSFESLYVSRRPARPAPDCQARRRPSNFVERTTVVRVRAMPGIEFTVRMTCSRPFMSGTDTFTTKVSSPATNQASSTAGSALEIGLDRGHVRAVGDEHPDERAHRLAERGRLDRSVVADDHARGFELADAFVDGRRAQPDQPRQVGVGGACVLAQRRQQLLVDFVHAITTSPLRVHPSTEC